MKKTAIILCAALMVMSAFISGNSFKSGINGSIDPPDGAKKIRAINGSDSVCTFPLLGKFSVDVKPGTWSLFVEASKPFKDAYIESITVLDGQYTDAGVIKLASE